MDLSGIQDILLSILSSPVTNLLLGLGLTAALIRQVATKSNLRKAAKDVAKFVDTYKKYDPLGASQLDKSLIEFHKASLEELEKNATK